MILWDSVKAFAPRKRRTCGPALRAPTASSSRSARTAPSAAASSSTSRTARSRRSRATRRARSRGAGCVPKGSASKQLVTSTRREYHVKYRRPYATEWEELPLDRAMDMIADRVIKTRAETWQDTDDEGRKLNRTLGIASLGGATLDNEENYLIKKLFTALGASSDREPGAHMTQLHRPRSGDVVRTRRRDRLPAGPAELRTAS